MKLKINLLILLLLVCTLGTAQDWKTYPYVPAGSLISFPTDEGRHSSEPIEWWYTAGHITGDTSAKEFSFMLTYFHYPQFGYDGFRILNISDHATGEFFQHVMAVNYLTLSTTDLDLEAQLLTGGIEHWKNKLDGSSAPIPFEYELHAASSQVTVDFELTTLKRPLILGDDGYLDQGSVNYTYYYSQTKNDLIGSLTLNGVTENVTGTAWIDRQYGNFNPLTGENYEWFSMQLSNGMDINLWNIFTSENLIPDTPEYRILSAYVDESTQYTTSDFEIERLSFFCTPDEVNCYASSWNLTSDVNNLDLTITVLHTNSEVQLPFRFFEGATSIEGTVNGVAVTGIGFAELLHHFEHPTVSIISPSAGIYDPTVPISWNLSNPDDGRAVFYDIEYSIDDQNSFLPIVNGITETSYLWNNPPINEGDDVWFKIIAYSSDGNLSSTTISDSASSATLSIPSFNPNGVKIYPNPVSTTLSIQFNRNVSNLSYEIIDIKGKVVLKNTRRNSDLVQVNVASLSAGTYFMRLNSDTIQDFLKFIKN